MHHVYKSTSRDEVKNRRKIAVEKLLFIKYCKVEQQQ